MVFYRDKRFIVVKNHYILQINEKIGVLHIVAPLNNSTAAKSVKPPSRTPKFRQRWALAYYFDFKLFYYDVG